VTRTTAEAFYDRLRALSREGVCAIRRLLLTPWPGTAQSEGDPSNYLAPSLV
jgi:hypothetical protein